ncbi:MAG: hypothetical protein PUE19_02525 [bacterium]|nr:hypothetical protein [bacterium]
MITEPQARLAAFEAMLARVEQQYAETCAHMDRLKAEGRIKTATYRQLFARKMALDETLTMYQVYGLTDRQRPSGKEK